MTSKLMNVSVNNIDANPWRSLKKYPFVESKVDALVRSIEDVGLWEGIIVRKVGNRYQLAFGHHRWKAAKKAKLTKMPVIVRSLDDEQMLQFMGRENLEDFNANFVCMMEAWEATSTYLREDRPEEPKPLAIAVMLGWSYSGADNYDRMNQTAKACASASTLIRGGYIAHDDFKDISVHASRLICQRALKRMNQLEKAGKKTHRPKSEIELAKRQVGRGAKTTIKQVKRGEIKASEIRSRVDSNAYREATKAKKQTPLFAQFGKTLAGQIERMLSDGSATSRIEDICKVATKITLQEDMEAVQRVLIALDALEVRAAGQSAKLDKALKKSKVISIKSMRG